MKAQEIKVADIHCFTDCGYNCKAATRQELQAHYEELARGLPDGWKVEIWHNGGWHAKLKHEASGFMLSDRAVDGGIGDHMKRHELTPEQEAERFQCFNYDPPAGTSQVWVSGSSLKDAIRNAFNEIAERGIAYMTLQSKVLDAFPG